MDNKGLCMMSFIEAFAEMYNVTAASVIVFFCGHILFKTYKMSNDLLKAKLFLNDTVIQRIWMYISIAGASFAVNALIKIVGKLTGIENIFNSYYIVELTQLIFLIAFFFAVYSWYLFISAHPKFKFDSSRHGANIF